MCRFAHRLPIPSTKSDASIVALPYWWAVCSPAMPAISRWSSGIAPQPIRVGITGTSRISASSTSSSDASALMIPPPATITGAVDSCSMSSAFSTCARVAAGL